jgi:hypothetical protein
MINGTPLRQRPRLRDTGLAPVGGGLAIGYSLEEPSFISSHHHTPLWIKQIY